MYRLLPPICHYIYNTCRFIPSFPDCSFTHYYLIYPYHGYENCHLADAIPPPWFQLSMQNHSTAFSITHMHGGAWNSALHTMESHALLPTSCGDRIFTTSQIPWVTPAWQETANRVAGTRPVKALTYGREDCHVLNHLLPSVRYQPC